METFYQADIKKVKTLLYKWIKNTASSTGVDWLDKKITLINDFNHKKDIFLAFSAASRFIGKSPLQLKDNDLAEAHEIRAGWDPSNWTVDQCSRILILLSVSPDGQDQYYKILNQLFETAEVAELTALYLGLPLYPYPKNLRLRAIEGFRTNMNIVFNAISLNNPYPKEYLDEAAWNQMVLKAIFIGSPLYKIQGIDERANATLANICVGFAHERWAAGRTVTPELWRNVGAFMTENNLSDMERVFSEQNIIQKQAAALACIASKSKSFQSLLNKYNPESSVQELSNKLDWDSIGRTFERANST